MHLRLALPRRHNFQIRHLTGAGHLWGSDHPVPGSLQLGQDDLTRTGGLHVSIENRVAVQIGLQAAKLLRDPFRPLAHPVFDRQFIGGQGQGFGHGNLAWKTIMDKHEIPLNGQD